MAEERDMGANTRVVRLGITPNGKVINYVKKENASIRFIEFESGGELPKVLQGGFCSVHAANKAVGAYLLTLTPKVIEDDVVINKAKSRKKV